MSLSQFWNDLQVKIKKKWRYWKLQFALKRAERISYDILCYEIDNLSQENDSLRKTLRRVADICKELDRVDDMEILSNQLLSVRNLIELVLDLAPKHGDGA